MNSKVPVINQIAWSFLIIQLAIFSMFYFVFEKLAISDAILMAVLLYSLSAFILRETISKNHRKGITIIKGHRFLESIPYFEKSIIFFEQNNWVDEYRFITLLSFSKLSYKDMGLCNIAFAYSQIGEGEKAIFYYEKAKTLNPSNGLAIAGLNMLNSIKQN